MTKNKKGKTVLGGSLMPVPKYRVGDILYHAINAARFVYGDRRIPILILNIRQTVEGQPVEYDCRYLSGQEVLTDVTCKEFELITLDELNNSKLRSAGEQRRGK